MTLSSLPTPVPTPISHRQFVSAAISFLVPTPSVPVAPLYELGYRLHSLEARITTDYGQAIRTDLLAVDHIENLVLLLDCKTSGPLLLEEGAEQVRRYFLIRGDAVILATGLQTEDPTSLKVNPIFLTLPDVTNDLITILPPPDNRTCDGWGIVEFDSTEVRCIHNELSDSRIGNVLASLTGVGLYSLPMELLPYERDCPHWELADSIFATILSFFVQGVRNFTAVELARASNPMWDYLSDDHQFVTERVRVLVNRLRRTALKGWIVRVSTAGGEESQWRFSKRHTTNRNVLSAFQRRHDRYVTMERGGNHPTAKDFERIDDEQLFLPAAFMQQIEQQESEGDS